MRHTQNVLANYLGTLVSALLPVIAIPYYIKIFGLHNYGLISFCLFLQGLLSLFDAGLGQGLTKEFSVRFSSKSSKNIATLLATYERVYFFVGLFFLLLCLLFSDLILSHWLKIEDAIYGDAKIAIICTAIILLFSLCGSLYRVVFFSIHQQVSFNLLLIFFSLIKYLGGLSLYFEYPQVENYFFWTLAVTMIETLVRRFLIWHQIKEKRNDYSWDKKTYLDTKSYLVKMIVSVWLSAVAVNFDRIILGNQTTIDNLGIYNLVTTLGLGVMQLVTPLYNFLTPLLISKHNNKNSSTLIYRRLILASFFFAFFAWTIYLQFGVQLLTLWLSNETIVHQLYPVLTVYLIGSTLNLFYVIGYTNRLVLGKNFMELGLITIISVAMIIPFMIKAHGMMGAASGWIFINLIGIIYFLCRK